MRRLTITFVFVLSLVPMFGFAQGNTSLEEQANAAYARKDWKQAAVLYEKVVAGEPENTSALYNAACSQALAGNTEAAFADLERAIDKGWANVAHLEQDSDLTTLHADSRWAPLVEKAKKRAALLDAVWNTPSLNTPFTANLSVDEKVAGLSKFWAEVRYNFAFPEQLPVLDWDGLYLAYLPKVRATASTLEYYRVMQELCARLKDGHTNVYPPQPLFDEMMAAPPMRTRMVEGRVFVIETHGPSWQGTGITPGAEVLEIDGVPVKSYGETRIAPYQSASTPHDLETRTFEYALLTGSVAQPVSLKLRLVSGEVVTRQLPRIPRAERAKVRPQPPAFDFRLLPGNIAYVALNQFETPQAAEEFEKQFDRIAAADGLILDVRNNGGGSSGVGYRVLATLTDKPFKGSKWSTRNYRPTYRAWGRPDASHTEPASDLRPNGSKLFTRPVVVLTSPRTYSAAEDFAVAFDQMKRGLIIGEPTGGSTGQPLMLSLPGGGMARICTKRDTYADGKAFVGVGVQPGKLVRPTAADLLAGRDTVLEAAIAELQSGRTAGKR